jgi:hypothetical protein
MGFYRAVTAENEERCGLALYVEDAETLANKNNNAPSKFLIIWLTDKATIPIGRSK